MTKGDFLRPKIVYSEIVREPQFYLDNDGAFFPEATVFIMTGEHLQYLIDFLNSPITAYLFKTFYAGGGLGEDGYRYKKRFLENLPIPKPRQENTSMHLDNDEICSLYDLDEVERAYISANVRMAL